MSKNVWSYLQKSILNPDIQPGVAYFLPLPLYHIGILIAAFFGTVTFAVMCQASCRHCVWTTDSDQVHEMKRKNSIGEETL
jgi:hypothetical protein